MSTRAVNPRSPQAFPLRFKSVYSNGVTAAAQARLAAWLRNRHGFRLADSKTTASLHVVDPLLNVQYSIAIGLAEGPTCVPATDGTNCHHSQCLLPYGTCIGFKLGWTPSAIVVHLMPEASVTSSCKIQLFRQPLAQPVAHVACLTRCSHLPYR